LSSITITQCQLALKLSYTTRASSLNVRYNYIIWVIYRPMPIIMHVAQVSSPVTLL